ncbi:MAG: hypothetical protein Ct9H300mP1_33880 [Planctomycetaceae bacterium]|nr:MAG: hypothetical protein Ct9H300mP1_33880 [Planctomycetaceae bacterium]
MSTFLGDGGCLGCGLRPGAAMPSSSGECSWIVLGALPDPKVIERFLGSSSAEKRAGVIDEVLGLTGDPRGTDMWANGAPTGR